MLALVVLGCRCVVAGHVVFEHTIDEQGELASGRRHGAGLVRASRQLAAMKIPTERNTATRFEPTPSARLDTMRRTLDAVIPSPILIPLRRLRNLLRFSLERCFSVDKSVLRRALEDLGMQSGDVVYVRSAYGNMGTIRATPLEVIEILGKAVGDQGTIVMPTYPVTGLSYEYLKSHPEFDWRRTPSRAGIISEVFRRMRGTERSMNPTHPVAARGKLAAWLTEGHELSEEPFDERSPFYKLYERNAQILSIGSYDHMTLRHFADHLIQDLIPHPVYAEPPFKVRLKGKNREEMVIQVKAHNPHLVCNPEAILERMVEDGIVKTTKVGRTPVSIVRIAPYMEEYRRYYEQGLFHHHLKSGSQRDSQID